MKTKLIPILGCLVILLLLACNKEDDLLNLEADFYFEGYVKDSIGTAMENIRVGLNHKTVGSSGGFSSDLFGGSTTTQIRQTRTNKDGFYQISISKRELAEIAKTKSHASFNLKFFYKNDFPGWRFPTITESVEPNISNDKFEKDVAMRIGVKLLLLKRDNPNIEYTSNPETLIHSSLEYHSGIVISILGGANKTLGGTDTLFSAIYVKPESTYFFDWRLYDDGENIINQIDTIQITANETHQTYWIEY